jgi:hypothetical protein
MPRSLKFYLQLSGVLATCCLLGAGYQRFDSRLGVVESRQQQQASDHDLLTNVANDVKWIRENLHKGD